MERCAHRGNAGTLRKRDSVTHVGVRSQGQLELTRLKKPPSVLPDLRRQMPRLPYLLAAIVIVGLAFALRSADFRSELRKAGQGGGGPAAIRTWSLLDIVNLRDYATGRPPRYAHLRL